MKIIITGGGGFLGSQLAQKLLERGTWNSQPVTEMNLDGGRNVFEAAREAEERPRVVLASSVACHGGIDMSQMMSDFTKQPRKPPSVPLPRRCGDAGGEWEAAKLIKER